MSRESIIMLLGLFIIFVPSFGIPNDWKTYVLVGCGAVLIMLGYSLRRAMYLRTLERANGERGNNAFVEHNGSTPRVITDEPRSDTETEE